VKLQTKLISFRSSEGTTKSRTFVSLLTSTSSDDDSRVLQAAGWIESTPTTAIKKKCGSCREDKTRRCFAGRQWRSNDPACRCCTTSQAIEARESKNQDRQTKTDDFVPPQPRLDKHTATTTTTSENPATTDLSKYDETLNVQF
jgi:hypothetical protein